MQKQKLPTNDGLLLTRVLHGLTPASNNEDLTVVIGTVLDLLRHSEYKNDVLVDAMYRAQTHHYLPEWSRLHLE